MRPGNLIHDSRCQKVRLWAPCPRARERKSRTNLIARRFDEFQLRTAGGVERLQHSMDDGCTNMVNCLVLSRLPSISHAARVSQKNLGLLRHRDTRIPSALPGSRVSALVFHRSPHAPPQTPQARRLGTWEVDDKCSEPTETQRAGVSFKRLSFGDRNSPLAQP